MRIFLWTLSNALVQLQAHYHHCGEAASEKCLSAATFVRWQVSDVRMSSLGSAVGDQFSVWEPNVIQKRLRSRMMNSLIP
jgi:hypothetical protein